MTEVFRATAVHAGPVGRLLGDFNLEFGTPAPVPEVLERRFATLLARDDVIVVCSGNVRTPTGFAYLTLRPTPYYDGPLAQLEELYVRPEQRARGIGTALMAESTRLVERAGGGEMQINVDEGDGATRRFYERLGFVNVEPGTADRMLCYTRVVAPS